MRISFQEFPLCATWQIYSWECLKDNWWINVLSFYTTWAKYIRTPCTTTVGQFSGKQCVLSSTKEHWYTVYGTKQAFVVKKMLLLHHFAFHQKDPSQCYMEALVDVVCNYIFTKSIIFTEMWQLSLSLLLRDQMNKANKWQDGLLLHIFTSHILWNVV